ncbi:MAG: hypothetical protein LBI77_02905 [Puniceicoccales bacterium]|jgi:hypothetical protein|nr:hypothetical protein [Puniceicoccales bacterium]
MDKVRKDGFLNTVLRITASLLAGGCASIGPRSIEKVHYEYNTAIAKTADEQLLLNIIRLKYRDNPYFLEVSSIAENRKFTTRIGTGGTEFGLVKNANEHKLALTAYSEVFQNPTITYTPLRGEQFTQRIVSPIPLGVVLSLIQAGWDVGRVFNLCVERINSLDNASSASGPTPTQKPVYESFAEAVSIIDALYKQDRLAIGLDTENQKKLVIKLMNADSQSQKLKAILGLNPNKNEFYFTSNFLDVNNSGLVVRTRSIMEVLFYLSHAVTVSREDIDGGFVTETKDETGAVFHWNEHLSGDWITVSSSEASKCPPNAFVRVLYRGKWFYIADNDLNSKSTFMFLTYLFNLQSGDSKAFIPSLIISAN